MAATASPSARPGADFRILRGMDPAANWLLYQELDDYLPEEADGIVPFLLELDDEAVAPFKQLEARGGVTVLGFGPENDRVRANRPLPVVATVGWLRSLLDDDPDALAFRSTRKRFLLSSPLDHPTTARGKRPAPVDPFRAAPTPAPRAANVDDGVMIAAIDDGFAFAHERFGAPATRIAAFWDMNRGFPYPTPALGALTGAEIDALVSNAAPGGLPDEDLAYYRAGLLDFRDPRHKPMAWRASHGTHVLDLAAGCAPGEDGPPILAVQLPSPAVARTTGELLDFYIWLGVEYACHLAGDRPLVFNISFGLNAGSHDGRGMLERALSDLAATRPRTVVVLPAGNAQLDRCHAEIDLIAQTEVVLDWIVLPDDRTHSIVEIWLPDEDATEGQPTGARMQVALALPDGTSFPLSEPPGNTPPDLLPGIPIDYRGQPVGQFELWEREDGRRLFRIAIAPTARPEPDPRPVAPAGRWSLTFRRGSRPLTPAAHAWVQRDNSLYGYPQRGRQSHFDHPGYERFDRLGNAADEGPSGQASPVTRRCTLNGIATGASVLVAGGYRLSDCRIARYSSGGPNVSAEPPTRRKPDVLLPSETSVALSGLLAAGARSGSRLPMGGTSVAAPQLARLAAKTLASGIFTRDALEALASQKNACSDSEPHPDRGGHGHLAMPLSPPRR